MTGNKTRTRATLLAQGVLVLNVVMLLTALLLGIQYAAGQVVDNWLWSFASRALASIVFSGLALLIVFAHARHPIGWLFLLTGFLWGLVVLLPSLQVSAASFPANVRLLVSRLAIWADQWIWILPFYIPISLVLQYFPDGRLPSRRWWPILAATLFGMVGFTSSLAFRPWPFANYGVSETYNPFAIAGSEAFFDSLAFLSSLSLLIGLVGSVAAVGIRLRRSQGVERLQLKWLVYTAAVIIFSIILLLLSGLSNPFFDLWILIQPTPVAIPIGIAILRYRLFDIDLIIRRTLQYTILTGILALIYFGLVLLVQGLFAEVSRQSDLLTVISTLVVAALFSPLRRRVQNFIDRRFYRRKYDAEQALAQFAAHARDDVDVDKLATSLLDVVTTTMHPERVGLWLLHDSDRATHTVDE